MQAWRMLQFNSHYLERSYMAEINEQTLGRALHHQIMEGGMGDCARRVRRLRNGISD